MIPLNAYPLFILLAVPVARRRTEHRVHVAVGRLQDRDAEPNVVGFPHAGAAGQLAPGVGDVAKSRTGGTSEAADWEAHKSLWRERLARLARDYLDGDARVDPKDAGATCRYCGLQPLCRIHDR